MDYARQQRDPTRHLIGVTVVVLVHAFVIYALMTGLGSKVLQVVKKPLSATIIDEVKLPPPPPPPPPKIEKSKPPPPPPEYVPPPDIPMPTISSANTITSVTSAPPSAAPPPVIAPPAPPPPPPPKPAVRRGAQLTIVEKEDMVFPREAIRAGVEKGTITARMHIDEKGHVTDVQIMSADPPRVFDREVKRALMLWRFKGEGEKYVGEVEINFTLKEE
jgi:periplasmic protein TonB